MPKLHYFNPGNETAILHQSPNYTPAANQIKMQQDLFFLPAWYANSSDCVWIENELSTDFKQLISPLSLAMGISLDDVKNAPFQLKNTEVDLWGIAPQSIRFFEILNQNLGLDLSLPVWADIYYSLCSRRKAIDCLKELIDNHSFIDSNLLPVVCDSMQDIETLLRKETTMMLAKAPYSSSGRGLLWLPPEELHRSKKQILSGILKKQSFVSLEKALNKQMDFAMLFDSDGVGSVSFIGLSLFETNSKGAYEGNCILSQSIIEQKIASYIDLEQLEEVKRTLIAYLKETYGSVYQGCIGVDMLVYKDNNQFKLYPCVEINMRKSMGYLALKLQQNHIAEDASGCFKISYFKKQGDALNIHQEYLQKYPAVFQNGKILSGYLPLCPVNESTNYWAQIII